MEKIVIAHPGTQHSAELAYALKEKGLLYKFYTSIFYSSSSKLYSVIKFLPRKMKNRIEKLLSTRSSKYELDEYVEEDPVISSFCLFISRIFKNKLISKYLNFFTDRYFDQQVSKKIKNLNIQFFIGYETSCLRSFSICKAKGVRCILDLAGLHWSFQDKYDQNNYSNNIFLNKLNLDLNNNITNIKNKELGLADIIIVPSALSKDLLINNGISAEKLRLVPYGVDINFYNFLNRSKTINKIKILYVGGLNVNKGIFYLLKAFEDLDPDKFELILVGNCTFNINNILEKNKNNIRFLGFKNKDELKEIYQSSDIFILPSLIDSFGLVVLEAMASGLPVIVTENVGAKDIVIDGYNGFIIKAKDEEAIKEKIMYFYNHRERIKEMGLNARETAEKYTWENYRKNIIKAILS